MASLLVHAVISLILHFLLILYGDFHDTELAGDGPLYTDVDYRVVTDAAKHVLNHQSPYQRATYRYTPLLAYLLTPNLFLHQHWGKALFSICDVLIGVFIGGILPKQHRSYALCWFYNPMSAVIATRGSYESIVAVIVLALLYNAKQTQERTWITGVRSVRKYPGRLSWNLSRLDPTGTGCAFEDLSHYLFTGPVLSYRAFCNVVRHISSFSIRTFVSRRHSAAQRVFLLLLWLSVPGRNLSLPYHSS